MNKLYLSIREIEQLLKWRDKHKDLVRKFDCPCKDILIVCRNTGNSIEAHRDANELNFSVKSKALLNPVNFTFDIGASGYCNLRLFYSLEISDRDIQSVLTIYASLMAFIVHGESTYIPKVLKGVKKAFDSAEKASAKRASDKVYPTTISHRVLETVNTEESTGIKSHHNSPSYAFTVRGHFRHYKSGKIVWIKEFTKGEGTTSEKEYRLNKRELREE